LPLRPHGLKIAVALRLRLELCALLFFHLVETVGEPAGRGLQEQRAGGGGFRGIPDDGVDDGTVVEQGKRGGIRSISVGCHDASRLCLSNVKI
jgi:hypothetical protein